jgi:hypothetical protein
MSNRGILQKWGIWLKDQLIGDVPPDDEFCEFECDKTQCSSLCWENCERRLAYANHGRALRTDGSSPERLARV